MGTVHGKIEGCVRREIFQSKIKNVVRRLDTHDVFDIGLFYFQSSLLFIVAVNIKETRLFSIEVVLLFLYTLPHFIF